MNTTEMTYRAAVEAIQNGPRFPTNKKFLMGNLEYQVLGVRSYTCSALRASVYIDPRKFLATKTGNGVSPESGTVYGRPQSTMDSYGKTVMWNCFDAR